MCNFSIIVLIVVFTTYSSLLRTFVVHLLHKSRIHIFLFPFWLELDNGDIGMKVYDQRIFEVQKSVFCECVHVSYVSWIQKETE